MPCVANPTSPIRPSLQDFCLRKPLILRGLGGRFGPKSAAVPTKAIFSGGFLRMIVIMFLRARTRPQPFSLTAPNLWLRAHRERTRNRGS